MTEKERSERGNKRKNDFLGINFGTAHSRLRKMIFFSMAVELGRDICFRCDRKIETASELSIDHKIDWLGVDKDLFWDIDNIAFSHLICNISVSRPNSRRRIDAEDGFAWCSACKKFLPVENFGKKSNRWNGLWYTCRKCDSDYRMRTKAR